MTRFNLAAVGRPQSEHHHRYWRTVASLVAALAGAGALLLAGFVIVGSVSIRDASWAFIGVAVLLTVWLTGMWWRWDAPDARDPHNERERRGF